MNQKKVIIKKKFQKKEPLCTWRSGQKQLLSSVVMTRPKMKMKKGFRSVAKTTTLVRALNLIDQTRPLPKKRGFVKTWNKRK